MSVDGRVGETVSEREPLVVLGGGKAARSGAGASSGLEPLGDYVTAG
jgi:hypothetical protein